MRKIRVLQFPISTNNGVKEYAMNNWKFVDKTRFQFDFALVRNNVAIEEEIRSTGAGVQHILSSADSQREQYIYELKKILLGNYDVVHFHTSFWKRLLIEEIAAQCEIPKIIVHSHSTFVDISDEDKRKKAETIHFALRKQFDLSLATNFCACSSAAADWLFGEQIPREKIQIMKNAIDAEKFVFNKQLRTVVKKKLGLEDNFVIGHIGRFSYQKNHEFLIDTFYKVSKQLPQARLLLIGEGPMEEFIKEKVKILGLTDKVFFAGQRSDVSDLLHAMDVFCLPSRFEGLGIVLIEAQTSGLPCLMSIQVPNDGMITDLAQKLPLDTDVWASVILGVAQENRERANMLETVTSAGYNLKYQIKEVEKLYSV